MKLSVETKRAWQEGQAQSISRCFLTSVTTYNQKNTTLSNSHFMRHQMCYIVMKPQNMSWPPSRQTVIKVLAVHWYACYSYLHSDVVLLSRHETPFWTRLRGQALVRQASGRASKNFGGLRGKLLRPLALSRVAHQAAICDTIAAIPPIARYPPEGSLSCLSPPLAAIEQILGGYGAIPCDIWELMSDRAIPHIATEGVKRLGHQASEKSGARLSGKGAQDEIFGSVALGTFVLGKSSGCALLYTMTNAVCPWEKPGSKGGRKTYVLKVYVPFSLACLENSLQSPKTFEESLCHLLQSDAWPYICLTSGCVFQPLLKSLREWLGECSLSFSIVWLRLWDASSKCARSKSIFLDIGSSPGVEQAHEEA